MPYRNSKPCGKPGCSNLVNPDYYYCEKHREDYNKQRWKERDKNRDPKLKKFYSSRSWRKVRNKHINDNPLCEECKDKGKVVEAEEVDHIVPLKVDWSKRLDMDNLQSLCKSCHAKKSQRDKEKYDI